MPGEVHSAAIIGGSPLRLSERINSGGATKRRGKGLARLAPLQKNPRVRELLV